MTGDEENMLFVIENMEHVVKGASHSDENCNFTFTDGMIFLKKSMFQHFVILSDAPNVMGFLIDANSVIRASFSLRRRRVLIKKIVSKN